jgi:Tol biopolymer transport system component
MDTIHAAITHFSFRTFLCLVAICTVTACGDPSAPNPQVVAVSVKTSGLSTDVDPDGYTLSVDGGQGRQIDVNGKLTLSDLTSGSHLLRLDGLASNCAVGGSNPKTVDVAAANNGTPTISVSFAVTCLERVGSIRITTTTTGTDIDLDGFIGYLLREGSNTGEGSNTPANGVVNFTRLTPGNYFLTHYGIAPNCDAIQPNPSTIVVAAGLTTDAKLDITCSAKSVMAFVFGEGNDAEIYVTSAESRNYFALTANSAEDKDPAWSPDGKKIAFTSNRDGNFEIYAMNADGTLATRLTDAAGSDVHPAWSPDGTRIAFSSIRDGNSEIYLMNPDGSDAVRITNNDAIDGDPAWSPDGRRLAIRSTRDGTESIWVMNADGTGASRIASSPTGARQPAWSPDGKTIVFSNSGERLYTVEADGTNLSLLAVGYSMQNPAWSPNGRKIAASGDSFYYGREVLIFNLQGTLFNPLVTLSPASQPVWRP